MAMTAPEVSTLGKIVLYTETLAKNPSSTVFLSLCDTYRRMGLAEEALAVVRRGTEANPQFPPGYVMLGRLLAEKGDLEGALRAYEKAISLDADCLPALKGLARVCFRQGDRDRTRALLEEAARLKPEDEAVRQMLSFFAEKPASPPSDEPPLPPGGAADPIATPTLAEIYLKQGLPHRAVQVYRDLLQADAGNLGLRRKMEELEERIRLEEAQEHAEAAAEEAAPAGPASDRSEPPSAVPLGMRQIEALTRWIEAVGRRKRHVQ